MTIKKRSLSLDSHPTSVALEPEFWVLLEQAARINQQSLPRLIGQIDSSRGSTPLASALRVWTLAYAMKNKDLQDS